MNSHIEKLAPIRRNLKRINKSGVKFWRVIKNIRSSTTGKPLVKLVEYWGKLPVRKLDVLIKLHNKAVADNRRYRALQIEADIKMLKRGKGWFVWRSEDESDLEKFLATQAGFAAAANVSKQAVNKWELNLQRKYGLPKFPGQHGCRKSARRYSRREIFDFRCTAWEKAGRWHGPARKK